MARQRKASEPEENIMEPGIMEPGIMEPGIMEPGIMEPGMTDKNGMIAGQPEAVGKEPAAAEPAEENLTLELRFERIESILNQLEDGDTSLEKAFDLYKKGLNEVQTANALMDKIEKEMLILKEDGSLEKF